MLKFAKKSLFSNSRSSAKCKTSLIPLANLNEIKCIKKDVNLEVEKINNDRPGVKRKTSSITRENVKKIKSKETIVLDEKINSSIKIDNADLLNTSLDSQIDKFRNHNYMNDLDTSLISLTSDDSDEAYVIDETPMTKEQFSQSLKESIVVKNDTDSNNKFLALLENYHNYRLGPERSDIITNGTFLSTFQVDVLLQKILMLNNKTGQYGYLNFEVIRLDSVLKRYLKDMHSTNFEKLFVPFLINAHFYMGIIDIINKRLIILDSYNMPIPYRDIFTDLTRLQKIISRIDPRLDGVFDCIVPKNPPIQPNGFDCGVYICHFLEYVIHKDYNIFNYTSEYKRYLMNCFLANEINTSEMEPSNRIIHNLDLINQNIYNPTFRVGRILNNFNFDDIL